MTVPLPATFVFEATTRCNHQCLHCYNAWKNGNAYPEGELGTAATLALLDRALDETGAKLVTVTGGEPLLRGDIFAIIDHLAARRVTVNLITNGTLLTPETIARLAPGKISIFELPLLSASREVHDRMSGAPGAFDRVTLAMARLKSARQRVVGVFVATRLNLPTWARTIELAVALGLDGLMFNRFNPGGAGGKDRELLMPSPAELAAALDAAEALSEKYGLPISCSIPMPPCLFARSKYKRLTFGFCAAGTTRAYPALDPLGNLRPCNHSPRILGNLRETGLAALLGSEAHREFVAARPEFCRGCREEEACRGNCKAAAEACCGSVTEMEPFLARYRHQARPPRAGRDEAEIAGAPH